MIRHIPRGWLQCGRPAFNKGLEIRDAGFIPEADRNIRAGETPIYDYMRSETLPYEEIMNAAFMASEANPENLETLIEMLGNDDSAIRYWAAQGLLLLGEKSSPICRRLMKLPWMNHGTSV